MVALVQETALAAAVALVAISMLAAARAGQILAAALEAARHTVMAARAVLHQQQAQPQPPQPTAQVVAVVVRTLLAEQALTACVS